MNVFFTKRSDYSGIYGLGPPLDPTAGIHEEQKCKHCGEIKSYRIEYDGCMDCLWKGKFRAPFILNEKSLEHLQPKTRSKTSISLGSGIIVFLLFLITILWIGSIPDLNTEEREWCDEYMPRASYKGCEKSFGY
jgi:hypothetical protein